MIFLALRTARSAAQFRTVFQQHFPIVSPRIDPAVAEHLIKHFRQGFDKLKVEKALKVSNWTCAMKEMGFWNADNSIRLEWYTTDVWEGTDYPQEFKSHMDKVYKRCHKLAEGLPVQEAEKMLLKKLGKQVWTSLP